MDVLSGVLEFVVKNILAPAVAVSATDGVVLKVPPVVSALTVGATIGVDAGAGTGVFEPPPPPHPRMKRAVVASPVSFNNVMMYLLSRGLQTVPCSYTVRIKIYAR